MILGGLGFGVYQILWTVGLQTIPAGDSALLIAATPGLHRRHRGAHRDGHAAAAQGDRGGALVPRGRPRHRIRRRDRALRVAHRDRADARRGVLLGDLHRLRGADPAAPLAPRDRRPGRRRWGARPRADRDRPARGARRRGPGGCPAASSRSRSPWPIPGSSPRPSRTSSSSTAIRLARSHPDHHHPVPGPGRWRSCSPAIFLGEPIRIGQVVGGAIIVGGVALTRRRRGRPRAGPAIARADDDPMPDPPGCIGAARPARCAPGEPPLAHPRGLRRDDRPDRRVRHGHGRVRDAATGRRRSPPTTPGLVGSRRLMTWEMAMVDCGPGGPVRDGRRAAARRGVRRRSRRRRAGGRDPGRDRVGRVRLLHRAGAGGAGRARTCRSSRPGPRSVAGGATIAYPERQPALPRLRHVQARPRAGAPGGRSAGRVHRRRRERPLRGRIQRRRVREALARADLPRARLAVPALDGVPRDPPLAGRPARRRSPRIPRCFPGPSARPMFCGAEVWGPDRFDPPSGGA